MEQHDGSTQSINGRNLTFVKELVLQLGAKDAIPIIIQLTRITDVLNPNPAVQTAVY